MLFLTAVLVTALSSTASAQDKSKAPFKKDLEEMFGQSVSCHRPYNVCLDGAGKAVKCLEPAGYTCFESERKILVQAKFDASGLAKTIKIYDGMNFYQTVRVAEEIIMLNGRGRFLKKVTDKGEGECTDDFTEEYQYLSMRYYSKQCQGAMPGGVTITWKE